MKFQYNGSDAGLKKAAAFCNQLAGNPDFWSAIEQDGPFDHTDVSSAEIANNMRSSTLTADVRDWRPRFWKWLKYFKTTALVNPAQPTVIKYNTRFRRNSTAQKVNTLVHEYVHVVDFAADGHAHVDYTHHGQSSVGNERSAPYAIGTIAQKFYTDQHPGNS